MHCGTGKKESRKEVQKGRVLHIYIYMADSFCYWTSMRNISRIIYADDTTLVAESEEE